jgi:hypothetical protein
VLVETVIAGNIGGWVFSRSLLRDEGAGNGKKVQERRKKEGVKCALGPSSARMENVPVFASSLNTLQCMQGRG